MILFRWNYKLGFTWVIEVVSITCIIYCLYSFLCWTLLVFLFCIICLTCFFLLHSSLSSIFLTDMSHIIGNLRYFPLSILHGLLADLSFYLDPRPILISFSNIRSWILRIIWSLEKLKKIHSKIRFLDINNSNLGQSISKIFSRPLTITF